MNRDTPIGAASAKVRASIPIRTGSLVFLSPNQILFTESAKWAIHNEAGTTARLRYKTVKLLANCEEQADEEIYCITVPGTLSNCVEPGDL